MNDHDKLRFVIFSLPRSGSTALAKLLNIHPDIRCLIEPFNPVRYGGKFHALSFEYSIDEILELLWSRWNGLKHVWDPSGFPFTENSKLNEQLLAGSRLKIIVLIRRNLLRRAVSAHISCHTELYIGNRQQFEECIRTVQFESLDPQFVRRRIKRDADAIAHMSQFLTAIHAKVLNVYYEDLFGDDVDLDKQLCAIRRVLQFLNIEHHLMDACRDQWVALLDRNENQWANANIYRRIPNISDIEYEVGSNETGWLFQ